MSVRPRYDKGDWKTICDVCGREFKASLLRKRWDGFMTCPEDWESRQPQDFVRGKADIQAPPWTRPEAQDTFVGMSPFIAGLAIAGLCFPTTHGMALP
jgi:hypothetical protein